MCEMTRAEWMAEAKRRFGAAPTLWAFVCPCCGHVATVADWKAAGAPEGAVAFSCVGRWTGATREAFAKGKGPCNYAGGGLIGLNPVKVTAEDGSVHSVFNFAESSHSVVPRHKKAR